MSCNVDLVLRVYPSAEVDVAALVREEDRWAAWREVIAPTAPWATYRTRVEEAIDCAEHVILLPPSFARLADRGDKTRLDGANAWTVRDGKISRVYHSTRADVLKLVGPKR